MGYYANLIDSDDAMRITNVDAVLDELDMAQLFHLSGRISWCKPVSEYTADAAGLSALLNDFGFESKGYFAHVLVYGWKNNKLGSSFTAVLDAISHGIENDVWWRFHGEDDEVWVEHIGPGQRDTAALPSLPFGR